MDDFGANVADVRGRVCGFPVAVHKKKAKGLNYGSWKQVTAKTFLQGAGTQPLRAYVDRRQATVAEWVCPRSLEDCFCRHLPPRPVPQPLWIFPYDLTQETHTRYL